ncbi:MAG: fatty acid desaturase [Lentisphaeria bacterium]|nr:fatty acid desaturase [Lentisphaeria bacterium]
MVTDDTLEEAPKFQTPPRIRWYRSEIDRDVLMSLTARSNLRAFVHVFCHLGLFFATGLLTYLAFRLINGGTWHWAVPVTLAGLFAHGTHGLFLGLVAVHELGHKTPFKTRFWNEFFMRVYAFLSWSDFVWFQPSHVKHHQATVHDQHDGEVVLPALLDFKDWQFWMTAFALNPKNVWVRLVSWSKHSMGRIDGDWYNHVLPASDEKLRQRHRNWARIVLFGHLALAIIFIVTGHWFLIIVFNFGTMYCSWLGILCGTPQHFGMSPNVPDFRLCCRTFTCAWLPAFCYWNMQYHIEHHMYPAVPFYNLPKLRKVLIDDLPPAPHGLWATWKEILQIHRRQCADSAYRFVPELPGNTGTHVADEVLEREAALSDCGQRD